MAATGASATRHLRRLDASTTALFLCDMQERFVKAIHAFDAVHFSASKLLRAAQLLAVPVYTTEQAPNSLGPTVPSLAALPRHAHSATVPKTRFSMLLPGTTDKWLAGGPHGQIQSVVLCGIEAHVCVLQTTLDLLEQGVGVWVVADGVSSCNAAEVPIALARMRQAGAQIATSESILFELMGDAMNPKFKEVSTIIRQEKENTKEALASLGTAGGDEMCKIA